jgi:hypothetical protein
MVPELWSALTSTLTSSSFLGFVALIGCGYFAHKAMLDPALSERSLKVTVNLLNLFTLVIELGVPDKSKVQLLLPPDVKTHH